MDLQEMLEGPDKQAANGPQFGLAHVLDFFDHVLPVNLHIALFASGKAAQ